MLFDELMLKGYRLHLDVKKTCYPNPKKINTILISKKQMQYACNNELKRVVTTCTKQSL